MYICGIKIKAMEISKEELIEIIDHIINKVKEKPQFERYNDIVSTYANINTEIKEPCKSCPNYKPGEFQTCWCCLPTMVSYTIK